MRSLFSSFQSKADLERYIHDNSALLFLLDCTGTKKEVVMCQLDQRLVENDLIRCYEYLFLKGAHKSNMVFYIDLKDIESIRYFEHITFEPNKICWYGINVVPLIDPKNWTRGKMVFGSLDTDEVCVLLNKDY